MMGMVDGCYCLSDAIWKKILLRELFLLADFLMMFLRVVNTAWFEMSIFIIKFKMADNYSTNRRAWEVFK